MCMNMIKLNSQRISETVIQYVCILNLYSVLNNGNFPYFCLVMFFGYGALHPQTFLSTTHCFCLCTCRDSPPCTMILSILIYSFCPTIASVLQNWPFPISPQLSEVDYGDYFCLFIIELGNSHWVFLILIFVGHSIYVISHVLRN